MSQSSNQQFVTRVYVDGIPIDIDAAALATVQQAVADALAAASAANAAASGANALQQNIENGVVVSAKALNLKSWVDRRTPVKDVWSGVVRTTAGEMSVETERGGKLLSIVAKEDFSASEFRATGFNLLRDAVAVGSGYYFLVPALPFGVVGTAQAPNGVLFTDNEGTNLRPAVYFKPLSSGVPASVTDGSPCAYTEASYNSKSYRFYTTSQPGYIIVSDITLNQTCAHLGWSRRYDDYVGISADSDAGGSVALSTILSAVHSDVQKLLSLGVVADRIDFTAGYATWRRYVGLTTPTWTNVEDPDNPGTYKHSAVISDMANNGLAAFYGSESIVLQVDGTTVSYSDDSATATSSKVKYELASVASGSVVISPEFNMEDWGLEKFLGVTGSAYVTAQYERGIIDTLAAVATSYVPDATSRIEDLEYEQEEEDCVDYNDVDLEHLPLLCGQPQKLYGAGTPQTAIVPSNWRQFLDGGYNWNGVPSALGQEYINTESGGLKYEAVRDGSYGLKWQAV